MKKVIRLTEADIENIVRKVLSEQESYQVQSKTQKPVKGSEKFEFGEVFPSAEYKIKDLSKLKEKIGQIKSFLSKYPTNQEFEIIVNAGESKVPNPKGFEEEGSLARARANELQSILNKELEGLNVRISFGEPTIKIGTTPWPHPEKGADKNLDEYTQEQFVNLLVNAVGEIPAPSRRIVPIPFMAGNIDPLNAVGTRHFYLGFEDGSSYRFNFGDFPQEDTTGLSGEEIKKLAEEQRNLMGYLVRKVGSVPFSQWAKMRMELNRICSGSGGHIGQKGSEKPDVWCYRLPTPTLSEMKRITDTEIADEVADKILRERLQFPTTEEGREIRVGGSWQPEHYNS